VLNVFVANKVLSLSTELNTSTELLLLIFCISQGSVVTHLRCGGKYDTILAANLLLSPTVKEFLKSANIFQVVNEYQVARFLMAHGVHWQINCLCIHQLNNFSAMSRLYACLSSSLGLYRKRKLMNVRVSVSYLCFGT